MNKPIADLREQIRNYNAGWVIPNQAGLTIHMLPDRCVDDIMQLITAHQNELLDKVVALIDGKRMEWYTTSYPDFQFAPTPKTLQRLIDNWADELRAEVEKLRREL